MKKNRNQAKVAKPRQLTVSGNWKTQIGYYLMFGIPALWVFVFSYIPMIGTYLAFIDYKPAKGILGSKFVGLKHFKNFLRAYDLPRLLRNTLGYNLAEVLIIGIFFAVLFALMLYEIKGKVANKIYHTAMLLPAFLSWTVVSAALLIFLQPDNGIVNSVLETLGMHPISWYREKEYWPYIILGCMLYKEAGMSSIYFYSALLSIDTELFDAANLDGASRLQQIRHISLPAISTVLSITLITSLGSIFSSGMTPFYQLTFNSGVLYDTTLVLGVYTYNGLRDSSFSYTAAIGLIQSVIHLVMMVGTNSIIKRVDPDKALF